jgi:three-Cys-motif partner protein
VKDAARLQNKSETLHWPELSRPNLHAGSFDEATLIKLELFQQYTREWLPVFTSPARPKWTEINLFDFFAGPGADVNGNHGSPLRILKEVATDNHLRSIREKGLTVTVHLSDKSPSAVIALQNLIALRGLVKPGITVKCEAGEFETMFRRKLPVMKRPTAANLLIMDQYGVREVSDTIFRDLTTLDRTDFIFFVSSSFLHRFADHPAIKRYIAFKRPEDYNQVHNVVLEHYRSLIPQGHDFWLAPFSIKKGSNVYGVIFGSRHPLGMQKFLRVAWKLDQTNGEANFDISREGFDVDQPTLEILRPRKQESFETDLVAAIVSRRVRDELAIYRFCLERGMTPTHAKPVVRRLRREQVIEAGFDVPRIDSIKISRPFRLIRDGA